MKTNQALSDTSPLSRASASRNGEQRRSVSFPAPAAQLATEIKYGNLQEFHFGDVAGYVGTTMNAQLDPNDAKRGTDTFATSAFSTLLNELKVRTPSTWVRGHLLNHDLGGIGHFNNLFPITTAANSEHTYEVEAPIKHWLDQGCHIEYDLEAVPHAPFNNEDANGSFICKAEVKEGDEAFKGKKIDKRIHSLTNQIQWQRLLKDGETQDRRSYARVDHGPENEIYRNTYTSRPNIRNGWFHHTDVESNYALHNNLKYDLTPEEMKGLQAFDDDILSIIWGDVIEGYNVIGSKAIDQSEIEEIMDRVMSEAENDEQQQELLVEELLEYGYTLVPK